MFDIGWSELVVIAVVALIAIGPKELPGVLRMVGQWMGKARKMAAEFQGQFNDAMREAEMADLKKSFDEVKEAATGLSGGNLLTSLQKDVSEAMSIDKIENIDTPPAIPTTPEPPTPETFVEAEAHQPAMEPLAIVQEVQPEAPAGLPVPAETHALAERDLVQPDVVQPDLAKDAKAS
ncbi:MAG: twin-arginine translocase subunit TatB [Rhodopseudomonas sp.]|uniref:Sec-independent protein translocase protein TatB n=1 Tax=Rhodopseudomonas sp. TaxID=1078 RepID=UPI00179055F2|nr:Sec-independent protein translocase protein TatB [Rhodopseudomonas sp.]NVN86411.1 twin-arginine translocase subunit TatB [Rhodopseudomonas sp.]